VREEGFNPEYVEHAKALNLTRRNAYQTLTEQEANGQ
jgi:hypothetical protein